MHRQGSLAFWLLIVGANFSFATARTFDGSAFRKAAPGAKPQRDQLKELQQRKGQGLETSGGSKESAEEIRSRVQSYEILLKRESSRQKRDQLRLNMAVSYLELARDEHGSGKNLSTREKKSLEIARQLAAELASSSALERPQQGYANYLQGMALIGLHQIQSARRALKRSLELNPAAPYALSVSLYLAEALFDERKYPESLREFQRFYQSMDNENKRFVQYKTAWIYLNTSRLDKAERLFVALAKDKSAGSYSNDSLQALAFVVAEKRSEREIIRLGRSVFSTDKGAQLDFFMAAYNNLRRNDRSHDLKELFEEIYRLEKIPANRIRFIIGDLDRAGADSITPEHLRLFERLRREAEANVSWTSPSDRDILKEIERESERLIGLAIADFSQTGKKAGMERQELGKALLRIFAFHDRFQNSPNRIPLYRLWLEVCAELKEDTCVVRLAESVDREAGLAPLRAEADFERLAAYENLYRKKPQDYGPPLMKALSLYLADPNRKDWLNIAKRFTVLAANQKQFKEALPYLEKIHELEKSEESFFKLQVARFELGLFEIIVNNRLKSPAPRLREIYRESALALAKQYSSDPDRFADYEKYIQLYLANGPTPAKAVLVWADYFEKLTARGQKGKVIDKLLTEASPFRFQEQLLGFTRDLVVELLRSHDFKTAMALLDHSKLPLPLVPYAVTARLALSGDLSPAFNRLSEEQKQYFYGLLALTKPKIFLNLFEHLAKPDENLRTFGFLAFQLADLDKGSARGKKLLRTFGDRVPKDFVVPEPVKVEETIKRVRFPAWTRKVKKDGQILARLMGDVRQTRKLVQAGLVGQPVGVQQRIVLAAKVLEQRAADHIVSSPLPRGLNSQQLDDYKKGLAEVAGEFRGQAAEFGKIAASLKEIEMKQAEQRRPPVPPLRDESAWPWPRNSPGFQKIQTLKKSGASSLTLLIALDLLYQAKEIAVRDYRAIRAGVLLTSSSQEAMIHYVYDELAAANESELLERWRKL